MTCHSAALALPPPPTEPPDIWEYTLELPHDPRAPGIARATVRTVLGRYRLDELMDDALLLTSEVVTNSYRYSQGPVSVRLRWTAVTRRLRISVWDGSPELPKPCNAQQDDVRGRGLMMLRLHAADWGHFRIGNSLCGIHGKVVWFECAQGA